MAVHVLGGRPHENRFKWKKININPTFFNLNESYCTFSKSMVYKLVKKPSVETCHKETI